ncbi:MULTISPECIES: aldehyde dehydrogenase (NADP(+)) [unclassified Pseudoalteromonas]|uniref:aldehyde dehydrogenase (NADP(+)) n=1 Tax=unclassified Pseudoalteromonas TaxID=194690 RepID=UPI0020982ABC|nr:aldehyde dehydrogenase (NADP(+)) [Pseudoalteromonas sp. XMcav2-N]MCO7187223.1 aldehyde dehydrogenase (NADP(+)) [Pseudoalteromonas sp. XMcav2-N]
MTLTGQSFIAGQWRGNADNGQFFAFCPQTNERHHQAFFNANHAQLNDAISKAQTAFKTYRRIAYAQRAAFLRKIGEEILALGDDLIETTMLETGLPRARLEGERMRTVNQLNAFAAALEQDLAPLALTRQDPADPDRAPLPKPATELRYLPVGVVAVFGASNFPYAFSTLGGDTAAALAAGCPVIVKSHTAHPGTSELMTRAIERAIRDCQMPDGVFSMIQGADYALSHQLVGAAAVKAVGFTGSLNVAKALLETIHQREEVIPLYGELGSVNPQLILPEYAQAQGTTLATALVQSLLMGNGQFCTSPGLWLVPHGQAQFEATAARAIEAAPSDTLLTPRILSSFDKAMDELKRNPHVSTLACAQQSQPFHANAHLFACEAEDFIKDASLHEEVFGPSALIVRYRDEAQLLRVVEQLEGQLTASVHATKAEAAVQETLLDELSYKVGRLIFGQMPTGVEVCGSMNHGGPYPSSTDVRSTSVGIQAMTRFLRPLCVQS